MTRAALPFARILDASLARPASPAPAAQGEAYRAPAGSPDANDRGPLTAAEREIVLEIAVLMASANGATSLEEVDSLTALVAHLRGKRPQPGELGAVLRRVEERGASASVEERVRALAATLPRWVARELAYKAAYAVRVADLESNPDEEELGEILVEALQLGDLAADLESEVNEALIAE